MCNDDTICHTQSKRFLHNVAFAIDGREWNESPVDSRLPFVIMSLVGSGS